MRKCKFNYKLGLMAVMLLGWVVVGGCSAGGAGTACDEPTDCDQQNGGLVCCVTDPALAPIGVCALPENCAPPEENTCMAGPNIGLATDTDVFDAILGEESGVSLNPLDWDMEVTCKFQATNDCEYMDNSFSDVDRDVGVVQDAADKTRVLFRITGSAAGSDVATELEDTFLVNIVAQYTQWSEAFSDDNFEKGTWIFSDFKTFTYQSTIYQDRSCNSPIIGKCRGDGVREPGDAPDQPECDAFQPVFTDDFSTDGKNGSPCKVAGDCSSGICDDTGSAPSCTCTAPTSGTGDFGAACDETDNDTTNDCLDNEASGGFNRRCCSEPGCNTPNVCVEDATVDCTGAGGCPFNFCAGPPNTEPRTLCSQDSQCTTTNSNCCLIPSECSFMDDLSATCVDDSSGASSPNSDHPGCGM